MEERNCACCGVRLTDDYVLTANDEMICDDCAENEYTRCECCNNLVYNSDIYGEDYDHILCHTCYEEYYTNCDECGDLIDRDALVKDLTNGIKAGLLLDGYEEYPNINNVDDCVDCVKYADTVIKAEGK
jgi:hypothetical protein